MPRAARQYAAVALLLALAGFIHGELIWTMAESLLYPGRMPVTPFRVGVASRTAVTGPFAGDQILAVNGRPFNSMRRLSETITASRPGDTMRLTLSQPDGRAIERDVVIPSMRNQRQGFSQVFIEVALRLLVPVVGLLLGFGVVLIRPGDRNAWLVLCLMLGFMSTVSPPDREGAVQDLTLIWSAFWNAVWPIALMFFGIYFPTRSARDRRRPWIKYVLLIPFAVVGFGFWAIFLLWQHDIGASETLRAIAVRLSYIQLGVWLLATLGFLMNLRLKSAAETSPDGRRRLIILRAGSLAGFAPTVILGVLAVFIQRPLFEGVPFGFTVTALLLLPIFPLTLGYVIVVERAMDLRFVIRMGMKYGLARFGLWTVRVAVLSVAATIVVAAWRRGFTSWQPTELAGVAGVLLLMRKPVAERASQWVDRKFFREAYDAERVLAGLASQVGRFLEVKPLLETVAVRIGETLHVAQIVILLREGAMFRTAYSTRPGEPMDIPVTSRIVSNLEKRAEPLEIYFDKPPLWIRSLDARELQTLDFMRTQLLLPVMGRDGLSGIISLGAKLSEAPYSETDTRLLQAVAWQTGMALENSRLLASLAEEAAHRERLNYELEIAREVQERLFPQSYPPIPGLEYCGYCRPAQGIGGDYYDFLHLADGKLGVAIGDVSGKGIAAALLMASLQASLRAQTTPTGDNLATLMAKVNRLVFEASTPSRYATCFYAEFDPVTRRLCYVNAGHNPPILLRGNSVIRLRRGGPVVGLLPQACYEQALFPMAPGDILILYTDGISEAMTESDEEWGEDRLIAAAKEYSALPPEQMIQSIFRAADAFTGTANQHDDMTLVLLKLTGTPDDRPVLQD